MERREFLGTASAVGAACLLPRLPLLAPVPTAAQLAYQRAERALFLHFGVNTFTDREWGDGTESPSIFDPSALDARQWARAARAAGFRSLVLTAKHHDGFCLWPSGLTTHSVRASPWREGRGDVVRDFVEACRAEGLGAGLYLSPWDRHEPTYGDSPRYNDYYIGQLTELLTRYGRITEVWFDGANGEGPNGKRQVYDWERVHRTVRRLQPDAVMFSDAGPDVRWIGNEKGVAGDPNWCSVDPDAVPFPGATGERVEAMLQHGDPAGRVWRPGEADVSIRPGWFWHPAEDEQVRTPDNLMELYFSSVGRNANLLLNVPPAREGLLHETDVAHLMAFEALRARRFADDLARKARVSASSSARGHGAQHLLDSDPDRWWSPAAGDREPQVTLSFRSPVTLDLVDLAEAIAHGQCVAGYRVDVVAPDGWRTAVQGTTIGHRKLDRVTPVVTERLRLTLTDCRGAPRLAHLRLFGSRS